MTKTMPMLLLLAALVALPVASFQPSNTFLRRPLSISEPSQSSGSSSVSSELPPVIQQIANERAEFEINLGRAMDTLRKDYPEILTKTPEFSIYHKDISVIDPSGVQLTGLENYKSAFAFLQTFCKFWFRSNGVQFRMVYDFCRSSIRISWHVVLVPKVMGRPLHIDGISYYQLDRATGLIREHKIETLVINNTPVAPPYGVLSLLQQDAMGMARQPQPQGVPAGMLGSTSTAAASALQ